MGIVELVISNNATGSLERLIHWLVVCDVTQVISRIDTVFNVVIPWIVISTVSVVSLARLLYTTCPSNQAVTQPQVDVDCEMEYIRSTVIAQLCASLTFVVLGLPAHVHQLSVILAGSQSAPVGLETYMTQRLLLVILYSRFSSTFFVHVATNRFFRRRLLVVLQRLVRRRPDCCGRDRSAPGDIPMTLAHTWSGNANGERPTTNGNSGDGFAMV